MFWLVAATHGQARGQNSDGGSNTSGGGGGRVAIVLNDGGADFSGYTGLFDARAGTETNFSIRPAGGTVYLQTGDQTA